MAYADVPRHFTAHCPMAIQRALRRSAARRSRRAPGKLLLQNLLQGGWGHESIARADNVGGLSSTKLTVSSRVYVYRRARSILRRCVVPWTQSPVADKQEYGHCDKQRQEAKPVLDIIPMKPVTDGYGKNPSERQSRTERWR